MTPNYVVIIQNVTVAPWNPKFVLTASTINCHNSYYLVRYLYPQQYKNAQLAVAAQYWKNMLHVFGLNICCSSINANNLV